MRRARGGDHNRHSQEAMQRMYARAENRDTTTTWATREAQYDARLRTARMHILTWAEQFIPLWIVGAHWDMADFGVPTAAGSDLKGAK